GRMVSGSLLLKIRTEKPGEIEIRYGDRLHHGELDFSPDKGNTNSSVDRLRFPSGRRFWYGAFLLRGFRYVQLSWKKGEGGLLQLQPREITYPAVNQAVFETSEEWFNRCWQIARLTLRLCLADTYLDNPSRERQQYGGDGYIQSLYAYSLFGDVLLWRQFLRQLAQGQNEDGSHQSGGPWCWNQVIPAWTLLWIESVAEYYRQTRDVGLATSYAGIIKKSLKWFERFLDKDGLLTIRECFNWEGGQVLWNFIDWQGGAGQLKGEPARLALNGFYAMVLSSAAELFSLAGQYRAARLAQERRKEIIRQFGQFHLEEHALVTATLAGAVSGRMEEVAQRINHQQSTTEVMFLFFTLKALVQEGLVEAAFRLLKDIFEPMMKKGPGTFWETREVHPGSTRAVCQAVGAAPAYWLPRLVAGIKEINPLKRQVVFHQPLSGVAQSYVILPTIDGEIELDRRKGNLKFRLPPGWQMVQTD
ncbi:MAG: hypothetical protein NC823_01790, partial [Candidatus Omnitrophica bacterium]|nr:hypothetical protein [Candidatus Omnitrophota bacterium]